MGDSSGGGRVALSDDPKRCEAPHSILLLVALAFAVAAVCLAGLVWDGSGYLFNALQDGAPLISHHRYSNYPVLWIVVQAGRWVGDPLVLAMLYGLLLAVTPVGSLALCLDHLRGRLEPLRLWVVLGILLVALPGQICVMSEATLLVQAFWPVLAIVAAGLPLGGMVWLAVLTPYLFFLHPLSVPLFGLAAGCCGLLWCMDRSRRALGWAVVFAVAAVARGVFAVMTASPYERGEFAWGPNFDAARGSLHGFPTLMLAGTMLMAVAALATAFGWLPRGWGRNWFRGSAVGVAAVGCLWAVSPDLWAGALGYRRFVLLFSLPIFAGLGLHFWGLKTGRAEGGACSLAWPAIAFSLVLVVQSVTWRAELGRFAGDLRTVPGRFLSKVDVPWIDRRPLDHWGSSFVAIFVQGREPQTLFSLNADDVKGADILLYPDEWLVAKDGWFRLAPGDREGDRR